MNSDNINADQQKRFKRDSNFCTADGFADIINLDDDDDDNMSNHANAADFS